MHTQEEKHLKWRRTSNTCASGTVCTMVLQICRPMPLFAPVTSTRLTAEADARRAISLRRRTAEGIT